jgi:hypothetical protein
MTTQAILFWGFAIPEDSPTHRRIEEDLAGEEAPPEDSIALPMWDGKDRGPVSVDTYRDTDNSLFYLAVNESVESTTIWQAKPITPRAADPSWPVLLRTYCDRHGIPWQEPGWYLAAIR